MKHIINYEIFITFLNNKNLIVVKTRLEVNQHVEGTYLWQENQEHQ